MKKQFRISVKKRLLWAVLVLTVFCAWTAREKNDIKKAEWLIGSWENKTPRGSIYETWEKADDLMLEGKSYRVKEKDTIVFETLRLVQEKEGLFYIPVIKNQNSGLPVRFASKELSGEVLVFENLQHDFPQIISYTRIGADSLLAEVSGLMNGQKRQQVFPMKRIK